MPRTKTAGHSGPLETIDLHCRHCGTLFRYAHQQGPKDGTPAVSCPGCGVMSYLPKTPRATVSYDMPEEADSMTAYRCDSCGERIVVGTFGNSKHYRLKFRTCPHCGDRHRIRIQGSTVKIAVEGEDTT